MFTFDEHMWDHLPEIQQHSQQGSKLLKEFNLLCKNYNTSLKRFQSDIRKHADHFSKNISLNGKKNAITSLVDHNYFSYGSTKHKDDKKEDGSGESTSESRA